MTDYQVLYVDDKPFGWAAVFGAENQFINEIHIHEAHIHPSFPLSTKIVNYDPNIGDEPDEAGFYYCSNESDLIFSRSVDGKWTVHKQDGTVHPISWVAITEKLAVNDFVKF